MLYCKLKFEHLPKIAFAHAFTKVNYSAEFNCAGKWMEIVYIEKGPVTVETDGVVENVDENSIFLSFHKNALKFKPLKDVIHTHYTVNLQLEHALELWTEEGESSAIQENALILPLHLKLDKDTSQFQIRLKRILSEYNSRSTAFLYKSSAMAVELLSDISAYSATHMKSASRNYTPSQHLICSQIKRYVSNSLNKNISLEDISVSLRKTPNYLSYVFKNVAGIPIKQYINQEKMNKVVQLLSHYNITLKEAGEYVGIYDQNYLSRLFKRVTGMSATEFKGNRYSSQRQ